MESEDDTDSDRIIRMIQQVDEIRNRLPGLGAQVPKLSRRLLLNTFVRVGEASNQRCHKGAMLDPFQAHLRPLHNFEILAVFSTTKSLDGRSPDLDEFATGRLSLSEGPIAELPDQALNPKLLLDVGNRPRFFGG